MEQHNKQNVLITGGAGSLGRAFCKVIDQEKFSITVVDSNEWAVAEATKLFPYVKFVLSDFEKYNCIGNEDYIIHAAAYKHADLAESNPRAYVLNNLYKTVKFYEQVDHLLSRLLYISTDKAVEPIGVYGATKMIAESLTREIGGSVARLGNILGSSGSVIPVWEYQIEHELPITVTDERMTRYVIEDVDAANQIWNEFLNGAQLIIPKMEEPKRILDILTEVLERHAYTIDDYPSGVEIIGMRRGEKLHEKLKWDTEL